MYRKLAILVVLGLVVFPSAGKAGDADAVLDSAKALLEGLDEPSPVAAEPQDKTQKAATPVPALVLPFTQGETALTPEQTQTVKTRILEPMLANPSLKLEIQAFASGTKAQESAVRRTALARALAIEAFLIENGIDERSVYPRALGLGDSGTADEAVLLLHP